MVLDHHTVAVVSGASGAIGGAVARALAGPMVTLLLLARDSAALERCAREVGTRARRTLRWLVDLSAKDGFEELGARARAELGRVDLLVHAAGAIRLGNFEAASGADFDDLYAVNLRGPFLLTKALLPLLKEAGGQIVFVNSTAALRSAADDVLYASTKSALRALANGLRDHVNPFGVRVVSVFPGRTASTMQRAVHDFEDRAYDPRRLAQPEDVAHAIAAALAVPRTAEVTEIVVRPMLKPAS